MANDILIRWLSESSAALRDMAKVERALGDTMTAQQKWSRRWQATSAVMRRTAAVGLGAMTAELVRAGKAAAVQEQAVGGLSAVFKQQAPQMQKWARDMSDMGLSMTDASTYAARLGASLKGAGLNLDQAATQTRNLTELGADLAATFGGTTADAVTALGATLRGEYDPLERYGAALKESEVNALLATKGQDKLTGAALEQAKMAARLELIWGKTQDAQGQAAREADTSAAAYQRFLAKLKNAEADLGKALLPLMEDLAVAMADLAAVAEDNPDAVRKWFVGLAAGLAAIGAAGAINSIAGALKALGSGIAAIGGAVTVVSVGAIAGWVATLIDSFKNLDKYGTQTAEESVRRFWNPEPWNSAGAAVEKAVAATMDRIRDLMTQDPPEIQIAKDKAQAALDQVQALLADIGNAHPKATIRAANEQAVQAAKTAQRAIEEATRTRTARLQADTAKAKADVLAWRAWADAQKALVAVGANTSQATRDVNSWKAGLFASINVSASVQVSRRTVSGAGQLSATTRAGAPVTGPAPVHMVVNINGFGRTADDLAREIADIQTGAAVRYNRRGLAR